MQTPSKITKLGCPKQYRSESKFKRASISVLSMVLEAVEPWVRLKFQMCVDLKDRLLNRVMNLNYAHIHFPDTFFKLHRNDD